MKTNEEKMEMTEWGGRRLGAEGWLEGENDGGGEEKEEEEREGERKGKEGKKRENEG